MLHYATSGIILVADNVRRRLYSSDAVASTSTMCQVPRYYSSLEANDISCSHLYPKFPLHYCFLPFTFSLLTRLNFLVQEIY